MKINIKQEKGITMTALVITVIILLILTNMLIYNAQDRQYVKVLTNLYNDIDSLNSKISEFYNKNGTIPAKIKYTNISTLQDANILSTNNDTGDFYLIDLEAMQGITLNYGKDYEKINSEISNEGIDISSQNLNDETQEKLTNIANNYQDLYIINKNSHNIFYVKGVSITEKSGTKTYYTNYTEPDETKIDLRYIDGILIPDGYYYIGKVDDNGKKVEDSESGTIIISTDKAENVENITENQYSWQKKISASSIEEFSSLNFSDNQDKDIFLKSVNHYKGYFLNRKNSNVVYLPVDENKWSDKYTENSKYIDKNGDIAYIPKGFYVSLAEETNEIRDGLVITDNVENNVSIGNEFVWIPVENGLTLNETETTDVEEIQKVYKSIKKYKGFYIGRYETGINEEEARTSDSDISQTPVIQKNKILYNYIKWGKSMSDETGGAVEKARSMYENSTLCYGTQWDAMINWLSSFSSISSYIEDSTSIGNYDESGNLIKTGNNEAYQLKNIYDLAGNVAEWTMEIDGTDKRVLRGGKSGTTDNIKSKEMETPDSISGLYGFRVALYVTY